MHMIRLTLLLSVLSLVKLSAQPVVQGQVENTIAVDYISSVEFGHPSVDLTLPIVDLNSGGQLRLDFDDLEGGYKTYLYRIIHCDRNWYPTETLDEIQYIDGFNDEEVPGFSYSTNAYSDYTHYDVSIPNDDITWLLSGNYALIIYEEDMEVPVLIRKFIVAESMVSSMAEIIRPRKTSKSHSHQELSLVLNLEKAKVMRPLQEIEVTVMQNGNWHTAQSGIKGTYIKQDNLHFDLYDLISFPAIKEFRNFDIRNLGAQSLNVHSIERNDTESKVLLQLGLRRTEKYYLNELDANGQFVIDNVDYPEPDVSSEYANVIFSVLSQHELDEDVYVFGAFSDWKPMESYRMTYDKERQLYHVTAPFKQGYYDYLFGTLNAEGDLDTSHFEGNWYETENEYQIIVYFKEFGSEYDRVLGITKKESFFR